MGVLSGEDLVFLVGGWLVMVAFVAMLGVHSGMNYANSRSAIAVSLGTVFFLCLGVATCMRIMVAFSGSFQVQLLPFAALMLGGGVGLYVALRFPQSVVGHRAGLDRLSLCHILCHDQLSARLHAGRLPCCGRDLWLCDGAMLIPAIFRV